MAQLARLRSLRAAAAAALLTSACKAATTPPPAPAHATASAALQASATPAAAPAPTKNCGESALAAAQCIEPAPLMADIRLIAKPRHPHSEHHQRVQQHCEKQLSQLGYQVERHDYGSGTNIIGVREGKTRPEQQIILSAHYDHIFGCPGADDNASGVAVVLQAARALAQREHARTLIVACWDEEERGLIGSRAYAKRARKRDDDIIMALALDGVAMTDERPGAQHAPEGFDRLFSEQHAQLEAWQWRGHFITAIGEPSSRPVLATLARHAEREQLPLLKLPLNLLQKLLLGDATRSDHASFWLSGYPGILLTDTANFRNPHYHCISGRDTVETLDEAFVTKVARVTTATTFELLNP